MQQPVSITNPSFSIRILDKPLSYDEFPELADQHLLDWLDCQCANLVWELSWGLHTVAGALQYDGNTNLNLKCLYDTRQWIKDNIHQHRLEEQRRQALDEQAEVEAQRYG